MKLMVVLESKNYDDDEFLKNELDKNPCHLCYFGESVQVLKCSEINHCRWKSNREIFVKKECGIIN